ncbi:tyrosine-type recombinase/integrase [Beijerinckia sp. L45]|uniref:tyrosine-type recombinase/integrase n=1 Tax=Beijerinckia sp. L45 TaxID=1641855 RepID=UPI00131C120F|nr:tyrosine-type recombinase/integrase [Beijerinckia sp. L45]
MVSRPRLSTLVVSGVTLRLEAPGLKRIKRSRGHDLYWAASQEAVRGGFRPRTLRFDTPTNLIEAEDIAARCRDARRQEIDWHVAGQILAPADYNGTVGSLFVFYQTHPDSPYQDIAATSRETYDGQIKVVQQSIGARRLDAIVPLDARRWFKGWRSPGEGGTDRLRRAQGCIQMLRVALSFGVSAGLPQCKRLLEGLAEMRFPQPAARETTMSIDQAERFIDVALEKDEIRLALGFAAQFELALRQADVIGQWKKTKADQAPSPSDVVRGDAVWSGLRFENINERGVLHVRSSKTKTATVYDLAAYPLVQRCLAHVQVDERRGPLVVRRDGQPFDRWEYASRWRELATEAGIPAEVWNRDVRASGLTEGRAAGATIEDVAKLGGHRSVLTTSRIYDRATLEATSRVQELRVESRKKRKK